MAFPLFSSSTAIVISIVATVLALIYRAALPKPIPGIPYNHASAKSVFGDIPSMMKWQKRTRETFTWMTEQCKKLNAPMVQVSITPFSKPWVIVVDARECQDVLWHRSKEFDRADTTRDVVEPILREHFFSFPSGPKQRAHRALLSDLMTPAFLNNVSIKPPRILNTHIFPDCGTAALRCNLGIAAVVAEEECSREWPPLPCTRRHCQCSPRYDLGCFRRP